MATDFTFHQGGEVRDGVLRPHHVTALTRRVAAGALERTHMFGVRIDDDNAPVGPEGVVVVPGGAAPADLVIVSDDDLTYAVLRLDERSTDVALAYVGAIDAAITRAAIWASLWNAVCNGLLDPRRFVVAVLDAVPSEAESAIRDRLLLFTAEVVSSLPPGQVRSDVRGQVFVTMTRLSRETENSDAQCLYTRAPITEFAARDDDEYEATVRDFASNDDPDIAWHACRVLAARGLVNAESIETQCGADGSGEAVRTSVEALTPLPLEEVHVRVQESIFSDSLSNGYLTAALVGLQALLWGSEIRIGSVVERMISYWESHMIGMTLRYADGVPALGIDVNRDDSVECPVGLLRRWINEHVDAPAQLRRIVVEYLDSSEYDERVQRRWNSGQ